MSISEARRQIVKMEELIEGTFPNDVANKLIVHGFSAVVEAIAENKPYDGTLNTIRIPVEVLRGLAIDMTKAGAEDIGMEDLILSLRARVNHLGVDK